MAFKSGKISSGHYLTNPAKQQTIDGIPYMFGTGANLTTDTVDTSSYITVDIKNEVEANSSYTLGGFSKYAACIAVANGRIWTYSYDDQLGQGVDYGGGHYFNMDGEYQGTFLPPAANDAGSGGSGKVDIGAGYGRVVAGMPDYYVWDRDGTYEFQVANWGTSGSVTAIGECCAIGERMVAASANGSIRVFDLDGGFHTTIYADAEYQGGADYYSLGENIAIGCGLLVSTHTEWIPSGGSTTYDKFGILVAYPTSRIWQANGSYQKPLFKLHHPDMTTSYSNDHEFGGSLAVGCGRIVTSGRRTGQNTSGVGSHDLFIYDINGNLVKTVLQPAGAPYNLFGRGGVRSLKCKFGRIWVGVGADNSGTDFIQVYDLDGNFLQQINKPYSDSYTWENWGSSFDVSAGKLVVGTDTYSGAHSPNGGVGRLTIYPIKPVYTPWDVKDMEEGRF